MLCDNLHKSVMLCDNLHKSVMLCSENLHMSLMSCDNLHKYVMIFVTEWLLMWIMIYMLPEILRHINISHVFLMFESQVAFSFSTTANPIENTHQIT